MQPELWTQAYQRFVAECAEQGRLDRRDTSAEHREHPRFRLWSHIVWTNGDFQFSIVDLSISGIAFDSNRQLPDGREITIRLSDLISARAIVIESIGMDTTPMFITGRYRVRCRFEDVQEGMRFLVMVKDIQQVRIET